MTGYILLGAIILIPIIASVAIYNLLVTLNNQCDEAWSNIDTELKRRYNLIPNLVNTIKGYAAHEKGLLEEVTSLRERCVKSTGSPESQAADETLLVSVLKRLFVRVENYPQLKASQNFLDLQKELANTEDRIQAARRFYNGNVRELNNRIQFFPSNLIASMFGFKEREFFEVESTEIRQAPEVQIARPARNNE